MRRGGQFLDYPVFFAFEQGQAATTSLDDLRQVFDRQRPFRLLSFRYQFCPEENNSGTASGGPVFVQFRVYGPYPIYAGGTAAQVQEDNVWTSPVLMAPPGSGAKGTFRIPNPLWWPSSSNKSIHLFAVYGICFAKKETPTEKTQTVRGQVTYRLELGPFEPTQTCPTMTVLRPDHPLALTLPIRRGEGSDPKPGCSSWEDISGE